MSKSFLQVSRATTLFTATQLATFAKVIGRLSGDALISLAAWFAASGFTLASIVTADQIVNGGAA